MKPLLIFKFPDYDPEKAENFNKVMQSFKDNYDIICLWGECEAKVYYPFNFISFHYNKLKAWLILKIWKNKKY